MIDDLREHRAIFLDEAAELLGNVEASLLARRQGGSVSVDELFRAFHTLKGSAGPFGYAHVGRFTHEIESALARYRDSGTEPDSEFTDWLLIAIDRIHRLLQVSEEEYDRGDERLKDEAFLGSLASVESAEPTLNEGVFIHEVYVEPVASLFKLGIDCESLFRGIAGSVQYMECTAVPDAIPLEDSFSPDQCYLRFLLRIVSEWDAEGIRSFFLPFGPAFRVEIKSIAKSAESVPASAPAGPTDDSEGRVRKAGEQKLPDASGGMRSLRIDTSRVDHLMESIGELVVAGVQIGQVVGESRQDNVFEALDHLNRIIGEVREGAMKLRMLSVETVVRRFRRLVSDLSRELGKPVDLQVEGEETELDRSVIERMTDPLLHILRNAIDHGIESPERRRAAGKPETGRITLRAFQSGGEVVIEIEDDGRGISRAELRKKAAQIGLTGGQDDPIYLIFEPGFSMAESLTSISGRGVGMDVVRRNIESLRGAIEVDTVEGKGTLFRIHLPLTLATINGLHVESGGVQCVIPLDHVVECSEITAREGTNHVLMIRSETVPCIDLHDLLKLPPSTEKRRFSIIVSTGKKKLGLIVDRLNGQGQSVVRPVRGVVQNGRLYGGFTLLGDGSVAVILNTLDIASRTTMEDRIEQAVR